MVEGTVTDLWRDELRTALVRAGRAVVADLLAWPDDVVLDAFCIVTDSGSCWFAWDAAPRGWRTGDRLPARDERTVAEFTQPDHPLAEDLRDELTDVSDTYETRLELAEHGGTGDHEEEQLDAGIEATAAAALADLQPDLARLPRTAGFVAHVARFDGRWPEEAIRRTVPDQLVGERFPGIAAGHRQSVELGEMATRLGPRSLVDRLAAAYAVPATRPVDRSLVAAVGAELRGQTDRAVEPVLDLLDTVARRPQLLDPDDEDCRHLGAWTRDHRLTAHLLLEVLPRLRGAEQREVEVRLIDLGAWLHDNPEWLRRDGHEDCLGLNESLVARCLHRIWPDRYPAVDVSPRSNALRNATSYGFTQREVG